MAKKTSAKKTEAVVYIGRSITGLPCSTVFLDGRLPAHVAEMVAKNEHLAALIVPISLLQEARKQVLEKGNILHFHATHLLDKEL